MIVAKRNRIGGTHTGHAWQGPKTPQCLTGERGDCIVVLIPRPRQSDIRRDYAVGSESRIDGQDVPETRDEQPRAYEQHERKRHLDDDECAAGEPRAAATGAAPPLLAENGRYVN